VQNDDYYYTGDASGSGAFEIGDVTVQAGFEVEADAYFKLLTPLVITPLTVLGGNVGFGITIPVGWKKDVFAAGNLSAGEVALRQTFRDDAASFGDPVASALIGWRHGNWYWNVGALVNIPIGQWEEGALANIGFNRWGLDLNGAITWIDPQIDLDLSAAAGFTFHGEKRTPATRPATSFIWSSRQSKTSPSSSAPASSAITTSRSAGTAAARPFLATSRGAWRRSAHSSAITSSWAKHPYQRGCAGITNSTRGTGWRATARSSQSSCPCSEAN
jgi:hypothetical protein